tara:strand:+ start:1028 stop:1402 length:375 start_codon:yes stop_codon:yes gene_type:complete
MYAYIVDNKISELYPSNEKPGKCIKMPDDYYMSETHDYKYDPETDSIVEDLNPPGPPTPTQAEFDEFNLNALRSQRNQLLYETDWMANSDVTMSDEMKAYRQALRDITKTYKNPQEVVWPTKPS